MFKVPPYNKKMKDPIFDLIEKEKERQKNTLMMIPSENYTYPEVREAVGSVLMHKYAEGYPGKRYYQGMEFVDQVENLASERAKKLFGVPHANVQPYSGSPANSAVYFALMEPGDCLMGMSLSHGGHLTHGHPKITFSGKYFKSAQYGIRDLSLRSASWRRSNLVSLGVASSPSAPCNDRWFDFDEIRKLAIENKPKVIVVGATAFPRIFDWEKFSEIADEVGAYLMADISHIAGLVAGGVHSSPEPFVHVITTTTHKTLRGPRGAMIMVTEKGLQKDQDLAKKIDRAVFPGLQGGPHLHTIAGIAVALEKAGQSEFKEYAKQVVANAKALAESLLMTGMVLVTGGTDNHLILADLRNINIGGKEAAEKLEKEGIVVNCNAVPNDPAPPFRPSGIRLGTPAITARGMKEKEMQEIGKMIKEVLVNGKSVKKRVAEMCERFPVPS